MLIAQGIGFIAMFLNILSFQQNTNKRIVGVQIFKFMFFSVHFFMIGAYTGAALNLLGLFRNAIFFCRPRKWASNKLWLYFFCVLYIVSGMLTYTDLIDVFPIFGMLCGTMAVYATNPKITRRFFFAGSFGWMVYSGVNFSAAGFITAILTIVSIIIAMVKYDFKKG